MEHAKEIAVGLFALLVSAITYIWHRHVSIQSSADKGLSEKLVIVSDKLQELRDGHASLSRENAQLKDYVDRHIELVKKDLDIAFEQIRSQRELTAERMDKMNDKLDRITSDVHELAGQIVAATNNFNERFNDFNERFNDLFAIIRDR